VFRSEIRQYLVSRILRLRIALLWILLTVATAFTADEPLHWLPWQALAAALFIAAFRLWDDLADLDFDRRYHPQRVLVKATNLTGFHLTFAMLIPLLAGLVALLSGTPRAISLLLFVSAFWLLYRIDRTQALRRNWRNVLVLAKYPIFILLLASEPASVLTTLTAAGVFAVLVLEETRDGEVAVLGPAATLLGGACLVWLIL
jgi:4-hydroxybenzoate polyprenyltransferase